MKVWVRGKWVTFDSETINRFYNLPNVNDEDYQRLLERPNYAEIIISLIDGQAQWKTNSQDHAVNVNAKHLLYVPRVWHHFITSWILPSTNICEVTKERATLNYVILKHIQFNVGKIREEAIWYNRDKKMNLGHPFLISRLCKQVGVQSSNQEDLFHPIKVLQVKKRNGAPKPQVNIDSDHESISEVDEANEQATKPAIQHEGESSTSHDALEELTTRVDAFWDEHQESQVSVNQQLEEI